MQFEFNEASGRYRDSRTKKFVKRSLIILETDKEEARLKTQLRRLTQQLISQDLTLKQWESRFAQSIKESHIRMSALGAGGSLRLTNAHFGSIGGLLRKEYRLLNRFTKGIEQGKYSEGYILNRASMYGASTRRSFFKGEQISRAIAGVTEAWRRLDTQAQHCPDCPAYATNGYAPIEKVVAPGAACKCGGKCRCTIVYRAAKRKPVNLSDRLESIIKS